MNNDIRIHISGDIFKLIATLCTLNSQEILKRPNDQGEGMIMVASNEMAASCKWGEYCSNRLQLNTKADECN